MAERLDAMSKPVMMGTMSSEVAMLIILPFASAVIASAPEIEPMKQLDDIRLGQRVNVVCSLKDGTPPISFSWLKDGLPVQQSSDIKILHTDEFQETLQIVSVSPDHVGNYSCSAKNSHGSDQSSVRVIPKFGPIWTNNDGKALLGVVGQSVTIDCSARGQPTPLVSIFRGGFRNSRAQNALSSPAIPWRKLTEHSLVPLIVPPMTFSELPQAKTRFRSQQEPQSTMACCISAN